MSTATGGKKISAEEMLEYAMPSGYATLMWGAVPYDWQMQAMDGLLIDGNRVAVCTCNASGKTSWLTARGCLWYMDAFPGSVVVTTSASQRQVQQQLYPNLRGLIKQYPNWKDWKVRDNNMFWVKAPNGSCMFSFATNAAGRAEGYHIPDMPGGLHRGKDIGDDWKRLFESIGIEEIGEKTRMLVVIDEAKSVEEEIFQAFERCRASNWLIESTPGPDPTGPFYECFTRHKEKFRCLATGKLNLYGGLEEFGYIGYEQCPHLLNDKNEMQKIMLDIKARGEDDAFVQSMHFGRFPKEGSNMIFNMGKVDVAMGGLITHLPGSRGFCCDFSGGGDCQPFGIRDGNKVWITQRWHETDAMRLADLIVKELRLHRYDKNQDEFIGDNGGIGKACNDILESKGVFVRRFDFGGRPEDKKMYLNVRSEGYFYMSKLVSLGQVILPKSEELRTQLSWHKYDMGEDRRIKVTEKKKMPHSPDDADVCMMLLNGWRPPKQERVERSGNRGIMADMDNGGRFDPVFNEGLLY